MYSKYDEINDILDVIYDISNHAGKVPFYEQAIRIADEKNDVEEGFQLRMDLINAGTFGGELMKAIVAFTWCISKYDQNPDNYDEYDVRSLLWDYKWISEDAGDFSNIPLNTINNLFKDFKERYIKEGVSLKSYYKGKCCWEMRYGNRERAIEYYNKWLTGDLDSLSDCEACRISFQIEYKLFINDLEGALKVGKPAFEQKKTCAEVPWIDYAFLLLPLIKAGKTDTAEFYSKKGYRKMAKDKDFFEWIHYYITYYSITNIKKAVKVFEDHILLYLETVSDYVKFYYSLSSWIMFERLIKQKGKNKTIKLKLSAKVPFYTEDGTYNINVLIDWFKKETIRIGEAFDTRDENSNFSNKIEEYKEYIDLEIEL